MNASPPAPTNEPAAGEWIQPAVGGATFEWIEAPTMVVLVTNTAAESTRITIDFPQKPRTLDDVALFSFALLGAFLMGAALATLLRNRTR